MSMTGTSIFDLRQADLMEREFAKVLKGYDPMEVDAFVYEARERIERLQNELRAVRDQRDAAREQYANVEGDAYRQVADRMADIIAAADKHVQRMLADSEKEATARREASEREAEEIRRRAVAEADRLEHQGQESLRLAHAEVDRILGGLVLRRDDIVAELGLVRQRVLGIVEKVDAAVAVSTVPPKIPPGGPANSGLQRSGPFQETGGTTPANATPANGRAENGTGNNPVSGPSEPNRPDPDEEPGRRIIQIENVDDPLPFEGLEPF